MVNALGPVVYLNTALRLTPLTLTVKVNAQGPTPVNLNAGDHVVKLNVARLDVYLNTHAAEAIYTDAMGMGPGTVGLYYFDADRRSYGPFPTEAARDWHKDHVTLMPRD